MKSFVQKVPKSQAKDFLSLILSGLSCGDGEGMPDNQVIIKAEQAGLVYDKYLEELTLSPVQLRYLAGEGWFFSPSLLPRPDYPFYWQRFEELEQQLEVSSVLKIQFFFGRSKHGYLVAQIVSIHHCQIWKSIPEVVLGVLGSSIELPYLEGAT